MITGASRGLGWAMAEAMAAHGARVILNARDPSLLGERADTLRSSGTEAEAMAFDVNDEQAGAEAIDRIVEQQGRLDVLVANAGIQHRVPFPDFPTDAFRRVLETNLVAVFTLARAAARPMLEQGRGRLIFTASVIGQIGRATIPAYTASKGGVMALTRSLAVELGPSGITCNAIAPGFVATEMNTALVEDEAFSAWVEERVPLGRWGRPEEIAGAAVYLASDAAAFVNGHVLTVDGGLVVNAWRLSAGWSSTIRTLFYNPEIRICDFHGRSV